MWKASAVFFAGAILALSVLMMVACIVEGDAVYSALFGGLTTIWGRYFWDAVFWDDYPLAKQGLETKREQR